jgi:molybdenum cofactor cytidylyltransferase
MSCAIVILAAGSSSRLGRPKQLLKYQGKTLLVRAVETALASVCRPVLVVLGAGSGQLRGEVSGLDVRILINPDWETGIGGSIRIGVKAVVDLTYPTPKVARPSSRATRRRRKQWKSPKQRWM